MKFSDVLAEKHPGKIANEDRSATESFEYALQGEPDFAQLRQTIRDYLVAKGCEEDKMRLTNDNLSATGFGYARGADGPKCYTIVVSGWPDTTGLKVNVMVN